jgi:hypothetical protein
MDWMKPLDPSESDRQPLNKQNSIETPAATMYSPPPLISVPETAQFKKLQLSIRGKSEGAEA